MWYNFSNSSKETPLREVYRNLDGEKDLMEVLKARDPNDKQALVKWLRKIAREVEAGEILDLRTSESTGGRDRRHDEYLLAQIKVPTTKFYSFKIKLNTGKNTKL
jgi:hypothetical protein